MLRLVRMLRLIGILGCSSAIFRPDPQKNIFIIQAGVASYKYSNLIGVKIPDTLQITCTLALGLKHIKAAKS